MKSHTLIVVICITLALFAFAVFVWPTTYRYHRVRNTTVRVHRITGRSEQLTRRGWQAYGSTSSRDLPVDAIAKLESRASVSRGRLYCTVYNGSNWRIYSIVVHLLVFEANSQSPIVERDYRLTPLGRADPLGTYTFNADLGFNLQRGQRFTWYIKSAEGRPE